MKEMRCPGTAVAGVCASYERPLCCWGTAQGAARLPGFRSPAAVTARDLAMRALGRLPEGPSVTWALRSRRTRHASSTPCGVATERGWGPLTTLTRPPGNEAGAGARSVPTCQVVA